MIHSFLLIGQSNMAGRGYKTDVAPIENPKLKVLRNGRWTGLVVPVNPDRSTAGINLAESFADLYQKDHGCEVGLIPCADGGTSLELWAEGGLLFDHACYMAELASRTSTIAGVLWHQGEADCSINRYPFYKENLLKILDAFRKKLDLYDVPFLVGGLGDFLGDCVLDQALKNYVHINKALKEVVESREMTGFVSATGLKANPDNLHFSAESLREFGVRYYDEFKKLERKDKVFIEKNTPDMTLRTKMELL